MKLHKFLLITCAIMFMIPFASAGLFGPDTPPISDGQLWQPIEKFKEYHFSSYLHAGDELRCFVIYKNQYDDYKCEQVSIKEYYTYNITEKCRC